MITVKAIIQENGEFELFEPGKSLDLNGNEIDVLISIGVFSKANLEQQKTNYLEELAKIDEKIVAINSLTQN